MISLEDIQNYCSEYNIPEDYLLEILEDQKVLPMIRGKATEYSAYLFLRANLSPLKWDVQKLNLNAQPNMYDEDISITHRKTGIRLKVESKNAVRGSFSSGARSRQMPTPHFKVKCHRSRSNISLSNTTNDRYLVGDFDLLVCNTSNALFVGGSIEGLEIITDSATIDILYRHYNVDCKKNLLKACYNDWRFVIPEDIAEDGVIPRTPYVALDNDPHWTVLQNLENRLLEVVKRKRKRR